MDPPRVSIVKRNTSVVTVIVGAGALAAGPVSGTVGTAVVVAGVVLAVAAGTSVLGAVEFGAEVEDAAGWVGACFGP
jgi:hypothetical protein